MSKSKKEIKKMATVEASNGKLVVLDMLEAYKYLSANNDWCKKDVETETGHKLLSIELVHSTKENKGKKKRHKWYNACTTDVNRVEWKCPVIKKFKKGNIFSKLASDEPFLLEREIEVKRMVTTYKGMKCVWRALPLRINNVANGTSGWHRKLVLVSVDGADASSLFAGKDIKEIAGTLGMVNSRACNLKAKPAGVETHCDGYAE